MAELLIGLLVMPWSTLHHPAVDLLIALAALPAIFWAACRVELPARLLPLFAFSGTISYAIYVLDVPFAFIVQDLASRSCHLLRHPSGVSAVILLPGIVLLRWCAHWYYDTSVRQALRLRSHDWLATRPKRTAAADATLPQ